MAGIAWFALEIAPPLLGFEDTDDPALSLQFLRTYPEIYLLAGLTLFLMAAALTVATFAMFDTLAARANLLALRSVSVLGLVSATFFFGHGVLRHGAGPMLHIDGLDPTWGQAAYLAVQMGGIHGFAQGAILALCSWAVGISLIGLRTKTLPVWLCAFGIVPGLRIVAVFGPLGVVPDALWIVFIASIPGAMIWCLVLGIVVLRRAPTPWFGSTVIAS